MIKKMLVNASNPEENRVAIVEDGVLSELDIEIAGREQTKGNIYKAAVVRVETGLQAAFVDYGAERLGFLQLGEIHPSLYPERPDEEKKSRPRINDILHRGQEILVQITKEERDNKGAALTTFLSLPGRYMVLMPDDNARGISRKIPDGSDRKALRAAIAGLELPENMGYIIRTAAIDKSADELKRDLDYLLRLFENISSHAKSTRAPALIYQESNLVIRSIRDYFTPEMDEVLIDDAEVYNEARQFFSQVMPHHLGLVKMHQEQRPIFSKYQIEEQIDTISHNQVSLPSGGSIVIDQTEALVAIDVNSGKMASEQGIEATAFKTDLEAATEVARQLRLRDLGGLVVIDFIDMRDRKHIREVERCLKDALRGDKARVTVGRISQFGLMEMSRQRIKASLAAAAWGTCPHCQGRGKVKSTEAQAVAIMRKIHAGVAKKQIGRVEAAIPLEVAEYLLNTRREELLDMERRYKTSIYLKGEASLVSEEVNLEFIKREKPISATTDSAAPVTAAAALAETMTAERTQQQAQNGTSADSDTKPPQDTTATGEDEQASAEVAAQSGETATDASSEDAPKRPRRRRRRGRRGGARQAAQNNEQSTEQGTEQGVSEVGQQTEEPAKQVEGETGDSKPESTEEKPAAPEQTTEKPRRSRSRRKKTPSAETEPPTATDTDAQPQPADNSTPAEAEPSSAEPAKPRRRRRSPTKKVAPATGDAQDTPDSSAPMNDAEKPAETEPSPAKPQRRRRNSRKTANEQTPVATETGATPVPEQTTEQTASAAIKKDEKPAASPQKAESAEVQTTAPDATDDTGSEAPKPKRRRAPRKKATEPATAAATEAPAEKPLDTTAAEAPAAVTEEKPKRRRTPRKKVEPKPATETTTAAASQAAEKDKTEATEDRAEEKPKPKRRTTRKKPQPAVETETPAAPQDEPAKPKRRAPRKKTAAEDGAETKAPATTTAPESEKPKPKRKPAARKKATPVEDNADAPVAEPAAKPRRGRPRKTAAKTDDE